MELSPELDKLLRRALEEDIGSGDVTTLSVIPEESVTEGFYIAKEEGIVCGLTAAARVFGLIDDSIVFTSFFADGDGVKEGDRIARVQGNARGILSGERLSLNLLQRLSGIATAAHRCTEAVNGTGAVITDTRKTTPGMRLLEKYAVRTGGANNHRFGLFDGVLIKDNHIAAAGGIRAAVQRARKTAPHTLKIEVETETLNMVEEALESGADIIMLDNMSPGEMKKAVNLIGGRALTEASGNMGDKDLREIAECGVDFISMGSLTHSVTALDISLRFKN